MSEGQLRQTAEAGIQPLLISSRLNKLGCHVGREALARVVPAAHPFPVLLPVSLEAPFSLSCNICMLRMSPLTPPLFLQLH